MEYFDEFLSQVKPEHKDFVQELHGLFLKANCNIKVEKKATGFFVSYKNTKTKRSLFNFYFRKNGLHTRLYPEFNSGRVNLTDTMISEISKAPECKRLANTGSCNPKCIMGYDFELRGKHYQKCRYCAFQFLVTQESKPVISTWVKEELV